MYTRLKQEILALLKKKDNADILEDASTSLMLSSMQNLLENIDDIKEELSYIPIEETEKRKECREELTALSLQVLKYSSSIMRYIDNSKTRNNISSGGLINMPLLTVKDLYESES